jgi:hypothetical protein
MRAGIFIAQARLVPRSSAARHIARDSAPAQGHQSVAAQACRIKHVEYGANRSANSSKGMSGQQMIASNEPADRTTIGDWAINNDR